jgi:hypothetical protein
MSNDKLTDENTSGKYIAQSELERLSSVVGNLTKDAQATKVLSENDTMGDDSPVLTMSSLA